jgi:hypothetical protein
MRRICVRGVSFLMLRGVVGACTLYSEGAEEG